MAWRDEAGEELQSSSGMIAARHLQCLIRPCKVVVDLACAHATMICWRCRWPVLQSFPIVCWLRSLLPLNSCGSCSSIAGIPFLSMVVPKMNLIACSEAPQLQVQHLDASSIARRPVPAPPISFSTAPKAAPHVYNVFKRVPQEADGTDCLRSRPADPNAMRDVECPKVVRVGCSS